MDVSENNGTPKSSIVIGFSIIHHPFWGTTVFGNTQICANHLWKSDGHPSSGDCQWFQAPNLKKHMDFYHPKWESIESSPIFWGKTSLWNHYFSLPKTNGFAPEIMVTKGNKHFKAFFPFGVVQKAYFQKQTCSFYRVSVNIPFQPNNLRSRS